MDKERFLFDFLLFPFKKAVLQKRSFFSFPFVFLPQINETKGILFTTFCFPFNSNSQARRGFLLRIHSIETRSIFLRNTACNTKVESRLRDSHKTESIVLWSIILALNTCSGTV